MHYESKHVELWWRSRASWDTNKFTLCTLCCSGCCSSPNSHLKKISINIYSLLIKYRQLGMGGWYPSHLSKTIDQSPHLILVPFFRQELWGSFAFSGNFFPNPPSEIFFPKLVFPLIRHHPQHGPMGTDSVLVTHQKFRENSDNLPISPSCGKSSGCNTGVWGSCGRFLRWLILRRISAFL